MAMTQGRAERVRGLATRLALCCCLLAACLPAQAQARPPAVKKAIWGPVTFNGKSQFPIYHDLGVGIYQYVLRWRAVAPDPPADASDPQDPGYHWPAELDMAVRQAKRYHIRIALMLMGAPGWATGGGGVNAHPQKPSDFADFAVAAARRYPGVHLWMIWGEPIRYENWFLHLSESPNYYADPARQKPAPPFNDGQKQDDMEYAELVDAAYGRLKQLNRHNLIIGGNSTTSGNVDPHNWIKNLRLPNGKPPRMDLYGHNPFGTRTPDLSKPQLVPDTADFCDLDTLVKWIDRYLARAGRNHGLRLFLSEYTAPTDKQGFEFGFHVTRAVQAKWLKAALGITRRWKRIYTLGWIGLRDVGVDTTEGGSRTGLIDFNNVRKPAYYVFKRG